MNDPIAVSLLPENSTPLERAVSLTNASRYPMPAELLRTIDDPLTIPEHLIAYAAWHYSVDIWNETWPLAKKRSVISRSIELHSLKGTQAGIEEYVAVAGSQVLEVKAPPQGMFMAADPTKEERNAYLAKLPAIRVYLQSDKGVADAALYLDDGFWDEDCFGLDMGAALYGRKAVLYQNGGETPLKIYGVDTSLERHEVSDIERVGVPGLAGAAMFNDDGFWDAEYMDRSEKAPLTFTYTLDRSYDQAVDTLWYSTLTPGLDPVSPRYERVSAQGLAGAAMFLDDDYWDEKYFVPDAALMFDQMRLVDPSIKGPMAIGDSFWDDSRFGMEPFTAEVMILTERTADRAEAFIDDDYWDDLTPVPENLDLQNLALDAVALAKEHHSKVLVTFQTTRPITFGDAVRMDGTYKFNSRVRAHL